MIAASWSFALDHAVARANALDRPLVVLEALRCGYRWASDRLHAFVIAGMADNARASSSTTICGCCGARRSSSGRRARAPRSPR
jgi:hypothetical protein